MSKILVTGGLGYIGSHTVVELHNQGYEVVIIDDLSNTSLNVLESIHKITNSSIKFVELDLKNSVKTKEFVSSNKEIDGVIHFAASKAVGESVENRDDGRAIDVIKKQLDESVPKNINKNNIMIAYEPIWAIGTGRVPNNSSINEMLNMIKDWLVKNERDSSINILYGGSVNKSNAEEIFLCSNIGGLLIGGVSLKADEFSEICLMVN